MGSLIDLDKVDEVYRCNYVKEFIIYMNLIGSAISLGFLIFGLTKMFKAKKNKTFLTKLIIIIFISEVVQCISKLLQMVKYIFQDERNNKEIKDFDRPRSVICQIQIVLAISSDFCSLFSTLLLTLRCYDVIKNKIHFFDRGYNQIIFIILDISISIILGICFLILDRFIIGDQVSYRYDVRDRCTYWCWLEHISSLICFGFYVVILVAIIYFSFRTYCYLRKGYKALLEGLEFSRDNTLGLHDENDDTTKSDMKTVNLSREEKKKIKDFNLMKVKSLVYPLVTIIYWTFTAVYRITDDRVMMQFDNGDDEVEVLMEKEDQFFNDNPSFKYTVQFFLAVYITFSAIRGLLYGFSFLAFEAKLFNNLLKKICKCCMDEKKLGIEDDIDDINEGMRETEMTRNSLIGEEEEDDDDNKKKRSTEMISKKDEDEDD